MCGRASDGSLRWTRAWYAASSAGARNSENCSLLKKLLEKGGGVDGKHSVTQGPQFAWLVLLGRGKQKLVGSDVARRDLQLLGKPLLQHTAVKWQHSVCECACRTQTSRMDLTACGVSISLNLAANRKQHAQASAVVSSRSVPCRAKHQ